MASAGGARQHVAGYSSHVPAAPTPLPLRKATPRPCKLRIDPSPVWDPENCTSFYFSSSPSLPLLSPLSFLTHSLLFLSISLPSFPFSIPCYSIVSLSPLIPFPSPRRPGIPLMSTMAVMADMWHVKLSRVRQITRDKILLKPLPAP